MMKGSIRLLALATIAPSAVAANAIGPAVFNTTGGSIFSSFDNTPMTVGWGFTTGSLPVLVFELGVWDDGGNGLLQDRAVGIWDAGTGALVVSDTVLMNDPIDGTDGFRYHALAVPFALAANTRYNIGVSISTPFDNYKSSVPSISVDPAITFTGARRNDSNGGFSNPTIESPGVNGRFGPNMRIEVVPEPATMVALGAGLAALAMRRRRK